MLKSHKAFSAVKQKDQSNKVASQEAAKGSMVTEGHRNSHHFKELKHSYKKLCKIMGFFPQLIRKHLALPAMCMCALNKYSQRARIRRDFVVCTGWDRKAQGRSQLDHHPHRQGNWWCQLAPAWWNWRNTAFAASKADFMVLYCKRVPDRILSAVKFFLGLPTHRPSIKISSKGIQSVVPTLWNQLQFLPSLMKWYTVIT